MRQSLLATMFALVTLVLTGCMPGASPAGYGQQPFAGPGYYGVPHHMGDGYPPMFNPSQTSGVYVPGGPPAGYPGHAPIVVPFYSHVPGLGGGVYVPGGGTTGLERKVDKLGEAVIKLECELHDCTDGDPSPPKPSRKGKKK